MNKMTASVGFSIGCGWRRWASGAAILLLGLMWVGCSSPDSGGPSSWPSAFDVPTFLEDFARQLLAAYLL